MICLGIGLAFGLPYLLESRRQEQSQQIAVHNTYGIDYSCNVDEHCVIKSVGNCCGGYQPKCVNILFDPNPYTVGVDCQSSSDGGGRHNQQQQATNSVTGVSSTSGGTICGYSPIDRCGCIIPTTTGTTSTSRNDNNDNDNNNIMNNNNKKSKYNYCVGYQNDKIVSVP